MSAFRLPRFLRATACALLASAALAAPALAAFPDRAITLVVPSAPGGTPDQLMRFLAQKTQERFGTNIVVENRPGASGIPGITAVYRARPDGYTIGYANNVTLAINRSAFNELPYDPTRFVPVAFVMKIANILAVNPKLPVNTLDEFLAYARENPGKVTFASPGQGTSGHLTGELLADSAKVEMLHVPYRGSPQATTDVIGGLVDAIFDNTTSISPHIRSGALRPLAVTSLERSPSFPDLPTVAQTKLPGFEGVAWGGIVTTPGTPPEVVAKLVEMFDAVLDDPAVNKELIRMGVDEVTHGDPASLMEYAEKETVKWAEVIKNANIPKQ